MSPPSFSIEESALKISLAKFQFAESLNATNSSDCAWPMVYYILQIRLLEANALLGVLEATPPTRKSI
jgi:hypothetical protein